ncbi:MAG: PQQ-dependent sugar dehydrogenase [Planctomycetes bacterium]|nr:PQQ-dependent sugar dehydrogenase [Planctomycetota bacterium]
MPGKGKLRMRVILPFVLVVAILAAGGAWLYDRNYGAWRDWVTGADSAEPGPAPALELVSAFPNLKFEMPLWFGVAPDGTGEIYVIEQNGRIFRFKNDPAVKERETFLDIASRIPRRRNNEEGLLAMAFHPKFKENNFVYIHYSQHQAGDKPRRGVTSRFKVDAKTRNIDVSSETILFEIEQPYGNHNGCELVFGADGFLYASYGDGGSANDPHGHGQNLKTWLGTVLRIDVDKPDEGKQYGIPKDNPFVGRDDALPEIWAYGLRNVWRMSFDPETGLLWGGDVGQVSYEEIDIIVKGGNYGWNVREGFHKFRGDKTDTMIDPVIDYERKLGISVTGGFVYRGKTHKSLQGVYVYADYGSGRVWGLRYDAAEKKLLSNQLLYHKVGFTPSSFGLDADGEMYVCDHRGGYIYRVEPKAD